MSSSSRFIRSIPSSTTASVSDAVSKAMQQMKSHPKVRFIRDYHTHPLYIKALADQIREHWAKVGPLGEKDRLMLSFHGHAGPLLQGRRSLPETSSRNG